MVHIIDKMDNIILAWYMMGFKDELWSKFNNKLELILSPLCFKAYLHGKYDAIVGDDISSVDYKTEEEILKDIYNP